MHRSIILSENGKIIFRHDSINNGKDNIEKDIFNFIVRLHESKNMISIKSMSELIKDSLKESIKDFSEITKDTIKDFSQITKESTMEVLK